MKICIAQINYRSDNVRIHIGRIKKIIEQNREADLIVFPELLLHGHPSHDRPEGLLYRRIKGFYKSLNNESDNIYKFVKDVNARVIIGELKGKEGRFFNAATYIDKRITESYIKTHVHWTENFIAGSKLKVFNSPFGKVGINICFDGAFPEVWRTLALMGAKVIVNISAVPKTFPVDYMWLRMKSAALDNQVFVVYVNRPGDFFSGYSGVFNPRGETVINAKDKEKILKTVIDIDEVSRWRKEERVYRNRRPVLYRQLTRQKRR